ncbi:MAG: shikimate kinase [Lachnospiraceae bacterium]|nr:shikimate kinase [Lachnospiraceae bacterium]
MKNLYLIGFMGAGKSTVAALLSEMTGLPSVEMDEMIVEREGCSIADTFAQKGEPYFREVETAVLKELAERDGLIISCGGGTVLREENRAIMHSSGTVIWLTATVETIYERVRGTTDRPVINGNIRPDYIEDLMKRRQNAYEAAADDCVATDGKEIDEICQGILRIWKP